MPDLPTYTPSYAYQLQQNVSLLHDSKIFVILHNSEGLLMTVPFSARPPLSKP